MKGCKPDLLSCKRLRQKNQKSRCNLFWKKLEYARQRAHNLDQLGLVVKAISEKARIAGLLVQCVEVSDANGMSLDDENTSEDVAIHFAKERGVNLSAEDLEAFMGVIRGRYASIQEFLVAAKAKPVDAVPFPVRSWQ